MQFVSWMPLTAMEIREKVASFQDVIGSEVEVLVRGEWREWVNGDEYNEKTFSVPGFTKVTNIGTRYLTITVDKRDWEVKPDLSNTMWGIIIRPVALMERVRGFPEPLWKAYEAVIDLADQHRAFESKGATPSQVATLANISPQKAGIYLDLLLNSELLRVETKGKTKRFWIR